MKEFFLLQTLHILLTKGGEPYKILAKLEKLLQKTSLISIWQAIVKDEIRKKVKNNQMLNHIIWKIININGEANKSPFETRTEFIN